MALGYRSTEPVDLARELGGDGRTVEYERLAVHDDSDDDADAALSGYGRPNRTRFRRHPRPRPLPRWPARAHGPPVARIAGRVPAPTGRGRRRVLAALVHPALAHLRAVAGNVVVVTTAATTRYPVRDGLSAGPKGAVEQLVRGLAVEEGRYGVRLNCVGPGMLTDGMASRPDRLGRPRRAGAGDHARQHPAAAVRLGRRHRGGRDVRLLTGPGSFGLKLDVDGGYGV